MATSYLRQTSETTLRFEQMTADEAFSNDSCAWYISYNPKTCYYTFKNVSTGKYISMSTSTATISSTPSNSTFQLLGARNETTIDDFTFVGSSYWVVTANGHYAMNATATGASSASFNHANSSTTQRWLFLTGTEVARFAESRGETVGIRQLPSRDIAQLNVMGGRGVITITALSQGMDVYIYQLDGRLVKQLYVQLDGSARVQMPRGIYLVNGKKVMVQ